MEIHDRLFGIIRDLVMRHSPSGVEHDIDELLKTRFAEFGIAVESDPSGNLVARIPGEGRGKLAITAHKDEIGGIITAVQDGGRLKVRKLGGSFPWVYGEGVVDLLGDSRCISGVLSFGSRHVSEASPQFAFKETAPLRWLDAWVETKLTTAELEEAGVRPGTRMVIGKHRKEPFRLGNHIASYALDNKAALAIMLELARRIRKPPQPDIFLIASAKEEVGSVGALYYTQHHSMDALIALEIAPVAPENTVMEGSTPVLLAEDGWGLYDDALTNTIRHAAAKCAIPVQMAVLNGLGSDGSIAMREGHVPRAACLGFPTQNTHGYEIAHLEAIENCIQILESVCSEGLSYT